MIADFRFQIAASALLLAAMVVGSSTSIAADDAAAPQRIVCLGDSITDGHTYPLLVQQALEESGIEPPAMINAGIGGDGVVGMRGRLDRDVLHYQPDLVLVLAGINDLRMSVEQFQSNIQGLFASLNEHKTPTTVLTLTPLAKQHGALAPKAEQFNEILRRQAKEAGFRIGEPAKVMQTALDGGATLHEPDGVHLNWEGYRQLTRAVLDALGHNKVAVPAKASLALLPNLITEWNVRGVEGDAELSPDNYAAIKFDDASWKTYELPEKEPAADGWWWDQERQRGVPVAIEKTLGKAKHYQATTTINTPQARDVWLQIGGEIRTLWLNGQRIYKVEGARGWHPGHDRLKVTLPAGESRILIETGPRFSLQITDNEVWE
jgi:lysophospholipase L1-like esterase